MIKAGSRQQPLRRGYVACDACRSRKVRCIIEGQPPCLKCEREHRDCRFNRVPKTVKHRDVPKWASRSSTQPTIGSAAEPEPDEFPSPGREPLAVHQPTVSPQRDVSHRPATATSPGLSSSPTHRVGFRAGPTAPVTFDGQREQTSQTTETLNTSLSEKVIVAVVTGSHDALDVLSTAAGAQHHHTASAASQPSRPSPAEAPDLPTIAPIGEQTTCHSGIGFRIQTLSEPTDETLDLWDKSRFVRQGLFTGQEAVSYVDLFFKYLSPLSAVLLSQFQHHHAHYRLIYEESMLCCTILLISSRFFMLPGAGGASRSQFIHNRMWHYTEFLIKRLIFGQEKLSTAKIRNIGAIESLILLSEWPPRAIHFPPESEGWDGLLVSTEYERVDRTRKNNEEPSARWRFDVFEPVKTANRMCWMLLGTATNLAHELGLFSNDSTTTQLLTPENVDRRSRAQRLLYAHVTQAATRLGYQSVFPEAIVLEVSRPQADDTGASTDYRAWNAYMNAWVELTRLSRLASSMFFSPTGHLPKQLVNDNYLDLLDGFSMSLSVWHQNFLATCHDIGPGLASTLLIEYHHLKALTGSIAVQAVVQKASNYAVEGRQREALSTFLTPREEQFLRNVITDSSMVLELATISNFKSELPLTPAWVRVSVISASVFLLKAISIGAVNTDIPAALEVLQKSTQILKNSPPDDMDFAMRYASLIDKFTDTFRATYLSINGVSRSSGVRANNFDSAGAGAGAEFHDGMEQGPTNATMSNMPNPLYGSQILVGDGEAVDLGFNSAEPWRSLAFDSSIAPFGTGADQLSQGLYVDSLDFLWNLPDPYQ